jgi:hypothetical protein
MRAFQSVRSEMRDTCIEIGHPAAHERDDPRVARVHRKHAADQPRPFDAWMEVAFEGLTHASETGEPYALVPCMMNGEPAAVIAIVQEVGSKVHVLPLFLACQPWMNFSGPGGSGEEGGGPDRAAANDPPAPR